ncbi:hypothetical protein QWJ07_03820 [Frankia sp. RB7]|nr:hypothetical protein [Frankia sp. RB7]
MDTLFYNGHEGSDTEKHGHNINNGKRIICDLPDSKHAAADAADVVRACNAHEKLVAIRDAIAGFDPEKVSEMENAAGYSDTLSQLIARVRRDIKAEGK